MGVIIPERKTRSPYELTTDQRVRQQFAHHRLSQQDAPKELRIPEIRLEPTNHVERGLLLDTWRNFFKSGQSFTGVHFAIFTENMIRITGGINEAGYRTSKLYLIGNRNSEITLRWNPSAKNSRVPGGNASLEFVSAEGPIADRIEYGDDLRGNDTTRRVARVREFIMPDKYRSPSSGELIDNRQTRVLIQDPEPFEIATEGRTLALEVLGFVETVTKTD